MLRLALSEEWCELPFSQFRASTTSNWRGTGTTGDEMLTVRVRGASILSTHSDIQYVAS